MINITRCFQDIRLFKAVTGMTSPEFTRLLPSFEEALNQTTRTDRALRQRQEGGGRKHTLLTGRAGHADDRCGQGKGEKKNRDEHCPTLVCKVFHAVLPLSILYPCAQTTFKYRGSAGLISSFALRCLIWTATAPSAR